MSGAFGARSGAFAGLENFQLGRVSSPRLGRSTVELVEIKLAELLMVTTQIA